MLNAVPLVGLQTKRGKLIANAKVRRMNGAMNKRSHVPQRIDEGHSIIATVNKPTKADNRSPYRTFGGELVVS